MAIAVCLSTTGCLLAQAQGKRSTKSFTETMPPETGTQAWSALNQSATEFHVENSNGRLGVRKAKAVNRVEFRLGKGKLVELDNGE